MGDDRPSGAEFPYRPRIAWASSEAQFLFGLVFGLSRVLTAANGFVSGLRRRQLLRLSASIATPLADEATAVKEAFGPA